MIKLYGVELSPNVSKVRYCLHYLGLEYDWSQTNPLQGENQTEEYLSISPSGKIPGIEIDGLKIFESNAINKYLAAKQNSSIYPQDLEKRVVVDAWMDFCAIHVFHAMGGVIFNRVFAPMFGAEVDENSLQTGLEFLDKYLPILDKQLGKNIYIAGDEFMVADINLLAILDPFELMQVSLDPYKNITKWRNQLMSENWYQKCYNSYSEFVQSHMVQMAEAK